MAGSGWLDMFGCECIEHGIEVVRPAVVRVMLDTLVMSAVKALYQSDLPCCGMVVLDTFGHDCSEHGIKMICLLVAGSGWTRWS